MGFWEIQETDDTKIAFSTASDFLVVDMVESGEAETLL